MKCDPNQGIETYKQFWLGTISLLNLALSATPNWRCIALEVSRPPYDDVFDDCQFEARK